MRQHHWTFLMNDEEPIEACSDCGEMRTGDNAESECPAEGA